MPVRLRLATGGPQRQFGRAEIALRHLEHLHRQAALAMPILLFEDEQVTQLYPVSVGKPAFLMSCGSYCLLDLVSQLDPHVEVRVRPHLRAVYDADHPAPSAPPRGSRTGPAGECPAGPFSRGYGAASGDRARW